jgi:hypothetical protein
VTFYSSNLDCVTALLKSSSGSCHMEEKSLLARAGYGWVHPATQLLPMALPPPQCAPMPASASVNHSTRQTLPHLRALAKRPSHGLCRALLSCGLPRGCLTTQPSPRTTTRYPKTLHDSYLCLPLPQHLFMFQAEPPHNTSLPSVFPRWSACRGRETP